MMSKALAGGVATKKERQQAVDVATASEAQLKNVRAAAVRWQAGLAGLSGTITIFGLVKGADDVNALSTHAGIAYGCCLVVALGCAIAGSVLAMRAAFGLPKVVSTNIQMPVDLADAGEARRTARLLHVAIWLTVLSLVLVAAALGIAWYGTKAGPADMTARLSTGSEVCGSVVKVSDDKLVLSTDTGQQTVKLSQLDGLSGTASCSSGG